MNKADQVNQQQLMRVYGALMWSLGKVFQTPEVPKVYIGSFNTEPINPERNPHNVWLFEKEQQDLLDDLFSIPMRSCDRKVNEFVKRVRAARTHLCLVGNLRKQMPLMMGHKDKQEKLFARLPDEFVKTATEFELPPGDLPNAERFRSIIGQFDLMTFPKLDKRMVKCLEEVLAVDVPDLMRQFDNPFS